MRLVQETIGTQARPVMRPVLRYQPGIGHDGLGHTAYHHVGDVSSTAWSIAGTAAIGLAAYHGYKRNRSVGWAIGWALLAGFAPIITTAVAVAQGVGKPKGR